MRSSHRHRSSARPSRRRRRLLIVAGLLSVVALAVLVPSLVDGPPTTAVTTPTASPRPSQSFPSLAPVPTPSTPSPSPSASASPRQGTIANRIRVDRLGIDLPIIEGDGLDAPLHKAAHYEGTAWPGEGSNIYLYAHAREGMFIKLWNAKIGDVVVLDLVDGTSASYRVDEIMPKVRWDAVELLSPTTTEQLTLQTCTSSGMTAPRFVVIARPVT